MDYACAAVGQSEPCLAAVLPPSADGADPGGVILAARVRRRLPAPLVATRASASTGQGVGAAGEGRRGAARGPLERLFIVDDHAVR